MAGRKQDLIDSVPAIHIVGEGDTEQYYFKNLKRVFGFRCSVYPRFCKTTSIDKISKKIKELLSAGVIVICVFDADVAKRVSKENEKLKTLRNKYRRNKNVIFCDSLPSIEYWFLIHFKDTCPTGLSSKDAERELKKFIADYEKSASFLDDEKWIREMSLNNEGLEKAMQRAQKYSSGEASYSNIHLAITELKKTII